MVLSLQHLDKEEKKKRKANEQHHDIIIIVALMMKEVQYYYGCDLTGIVISLFVLVVNDVA